MPFTSSVRDLVGVGAELVPWLGEYQSSMRETPESVAHVKARLSLLLNGLRQWEGHARAGRIDSRIQEALIPTLDACKDRVGRLAQLVDPKLPTRADFATARSVKAARILPEDAKVQKLVSDIDSYLTALTFHNDGLNSRPDPVDPALHWVNMIPVARDPNFVDRPQIFRGIDAILEEHGRRAALAGIRGTGKTQIAIEYCHRTLQAQPRTHIFWVHAGSTSKLLRSCVEITGQLQIAGWDTPHFDTLRQLYRWLSEKKNGDWVLVVDNADDLGVLEERLSSDNGPKDLSQLLAYRPHGKYLITTRDRRVGARLCTWGKTISVDAMSPSEARLLMSAYIPSSSESTVESIDELIAELNFLPLAISQATAYMVASDTATEEYLLLLRKGDEERPALLNQSIRDDRYGGTELNPWIKTWKLSFDKIIRRSPQVADLLSIMAMFDRQEIPVMLLRSTESKHAFYSWIATLQKFALIVKESKPESYQMHSLVQVCVQAYLQSQGTLQEWQGEALSRLSTLFPSGEYENWDVCRLLIPHAQIVLSCDPLPGPRVPKRAVLLRRVALYQQDRVQSKVASLQAEKTFSLLVNAPGFEASDVLSANIDSAICLAYADRPKDALRLHDAFSPELEKTYGPAHPERLRAMHNLALVKHKIGEHMAAIELFRKVLDLLERHSGPMHSLTLRTKFLLALCLSENTADADLTESKTMMRDALVGRKQLLGFYHPETVECLIHYATIVAKVGDREEAEIIHRHALKSTQRLYGPENVKTLIASQNLAWCLKKRGKTEEAPSLSRAMLISKEGILGVDNIETIRGRYNLICLLTELEQWEEVALHSRINLNCKDAIDAYASQGHDMSQIISNAEVALEMAENFTGESAGSTDFVQRKNR